MKQRLNHAEISPQLVNKLVDLSNTVSEGPLERGLILLVEIRASQMNGCTFCVDMHVKQAKILGERELRLHHIPVWRESNLFSEKERAALEWTEIVTSITDKGISDEAYGKVKEHFSEKEIVDLTFAIGIINVWNRVNGVSRSQAGALDKVFGLDKAGLN